MHLYLIRHAHAEDGRPDQARPLSRKGRAQIRRLARFLRTASALDVAEIWHSPLVRSRETAAELRRRLKSRAPLTEISGLKPEDDPAVTARRLGAVNRPVAIVGHDPHLSALASLLVGGPAEPAGFRLKKGAALRLDRSGGGWSARWLVTPELL